MANNYSPERMENIPLTDTPIGAGPGTILLPIIPPVEKLAVPQPTPRRSKPPGLPRDTILAEYADTVNSIMDEYQKGGDDEEIIEKAREEIKQMNRDLGFMQRRGARKKDITALRAMRNELNSLVKHAPTVDQFEPMVGLESLYIDEPNSIESSVQDSMSHNNDPQPTNEEGLEGRLRALELLVGEKVEGANGRIDRQDRIVEGLLNRIRVQEEIRTRNTRSIEEYQQVPLDIIHIKEDMSAFKKEMSRLEKSVLNLGECVSELSEENIKLRDRLSKVQTEGLPRVRHSTGLEEPTAEEVQEQVSCLEDTMWILIGSIEGTINQAVDLSSDPMYLKDMYRNEMPRLDKQASDIKTDLNRYIRLPGHDTRVKDKIIAILKRAEKWKQELKKIWNQKEIFSVVPSSKETMADVG